MYIDNVYYVTLEVQPSFFSPVGFLELPSLTLRFRPIFRAYVTVVLGSVVYIYLVLLVVMSFLRLFFFFEFREFSG